MFLNPDREIGERLITLCRSKPIRRMVPSDFYNGVPVTIVKGRRRSDIYKDYITDNGPQTLIDLAFHFKRSRSAISQTLMATDGIRREIDGRQVRYFVT